MTLSPETPWLRTAFKISLVLGVFMVACAWFSIGFHQLDEYAMITEFASAKLGITDPKTLSWEYASKIRPWLHPAINVLIARTAEAVGFHDRFIQAFLFRLIAGIFSWAALFLLMLSFPRLGVPEDKRKLTAWVLTFLFFTPYLMVRPSSEMTAAAFLTGAIALISLGLKSGGSTLGHDKKESSSPSVILAGFIMGFAFVFRYQTGAVALGIGGWLLFRTQSGLKNFLFFSFALVPPILLGFMIDHWGYGEWTFTPWNYFRENLVKGVAATMGTKPFYAFFYLTAQGPFAPLIFFVMLGTFLFWIRFPSHLLTWAAVPFFLLHSAIAHKEPRFMFPLAWVAAISFFLFLSAPPQSSEKSFYSKIQSRLGRMAAWLWSKRNTWAARIVYGLNLFALLIFLFSPVRTEIQMQRVVYKNVPAGSELYSRGWDPYENMGAGGMYFYRPNGLVLRKIRDDAALFKLLASKTTEPVYYSLDEGRLPEGNSAEERKQLSRARLLFQTLPDWTSHFNFFNWQERTAQWRFYRFDAN